MILKTKNLYKKYNKKYIIKNISLQLKQGEIVGLIGPNGAGKTTIFYTLIGLIHPEKGSLFLDTEDITNLPLYKRSRKGLGYLSQDPSIFRRLSVEDNILSILEMHKKYFKNKKEITEKLLKELGIQKIRKNQGYSLSGGERKKTEIARCLAINPKLILLDEPFSGIDPMTIEELQKIFITLKKKNIGILITDHNIKELFSITDRMYLIYKGKILKEGTSKEVMKDPFVIKIYLGSYFKKWKI
ncbi:LPS export ABC transporter ATP-binding protein [Blattabacterium cuenoti]|uniref:LPS export ABC transporter ATP-binding protein n=1 Tax=Blattabacterium cuenoti TaxID=1653831 RepID=UPI00163CD16D|nr:LPS export ABC transporter ATP-binding protein [Blattabacterium cuenoti]